MDYPIRPLSGSNNSGNGPVPFIRNPSPPTGAFVKRAFAEVRPGTLIRMLDELPMTIAKIACRVFPERRITPPQSPDGTKVLLGEHQSVMWAGCDIFWTSTVPSNSNSVPSNATHGSGHFELTSWQCLLIALQTRESHQSTCGAKSPVSRILLSCR